MAETIQLPACSVPVIADVDIAVAGGSCTGVFAAVTAARKGARVAVIEPQNRFGGTCTAGQVCIWHSFFATDDKTQIVFGLSQEIVDRLNRRNLVEFWDKPNPHCYVNLNTEELCMELDEMVQEAHVMPFLHSRAVGVLKSDDGHLTSLIVASKDGLGVVKAKVFIDATGDSDIVRYAGGQLWRNDVMQTSTACVKVSQWPVGIATGKIIHEYAAKYNLPEGFIWGKKSVGSNTYMLAGTNIPNIDESTQAGLTASEIEGRRQMRAFMDIIAETGRPRPVIEALPSLVGIRETWHIRSLHQITTDELLSGKVFPDAAGKGTYRSDIHMRNPVGTLFRYLDGTQIFQSPYKPAETSRWRDESLPTPPYYTWPVRSQIPVGFDNLITAGRMIDADAGAYGALRVMINMNQSGETAGDVAFKSLDKNRPIHECWQ